VVSIVKFDIFKTLLFCGLANTCRVHVEYIQSGRELNTIVLFNITAFVVALEHHHEYDIVQARGVLKVYDGVLLFVGVSTGDTSDIIGGACVTVTKSIHALSNHQKASASLA